MGDSTRVLSGVLVAGFTFRPEEQTMYYLPAKYLRELGCSIYVLSRRLGTTQKSVGGVEKLDSYESVMPVVQWKIPLPLRLLDAMLSRLTRGAVSNFFGFFAAAAEAAVRRPDFILTNEIQGLIPIKIVRRLISPRTIIVYNMFDLMVRLMSRGRNDSFSLRFALTINEFKCPGWADAILVSTDFARRYLISRGINSDKICILKELSKVRFAEVSDEFMGSVQRKYVIDSRRPVFIWVGVHRSHYTFGLEQLVRAMGSSQELRGAQLLILGHDLHATSPSILALARELGVRLINPGKVPWEEFAALLKSSTAGLHLLPPDLACRYLIGTKLVDYIAAGIPVVCSDLDAAKEELRGTGFMFRPMDEADLRLKMEIVARSDPSRIRQRAARLADEAYDESRLRRAYSELYSFLLGAMVQRT